MRELFMFTQHKYYEYANEQKKHNKNEKKNVVDGS